ncbi:amino acid permease [Paenibacillus sp. P25]|nr:amino acid permease [Paenibacillus sp. P25]
MHDRHRFFLGSGLAIRIGGPSALISFILAALVTLIVFDVLAKMTSEDPLEGSFRSYAKKAFGRWAGFSSGYVYWSAELLIMGSQLTALSLFSRHWFPQMPMWIFASGYAVLGLTVIVIGTRAFERVENLFAVIKIAAILMFIAIAALALAGIIPGHAGRLRLQDAFSPFVPDGFRGWWSSLLFAFYAFGGIEIMGLMALRLSKPEEAPKAGRMMLLLIAVIYVVSLFLAMLLVPWETFHSKKSPFMMALGPYRLPWVPDLFNAVLIIAGFSTMVASLFAVTQILVTLSNDGDAPAFFSRKWKNRPLAAIGLTTAGLAASIVLALLMPGQVYEYFTTAAGLMLIYNWCFILVTAGKLLKLSAWGTWKRYAGIAVLLAAVSGALFHGTSRPGFYISLLFALVIGLVTLLVHYRRKGREVGQGQPGAVHRYSPEEEPERFKSKIGAKTD